MKLSDKILTLRKQAGLSQEELAEKMNVSRQALSRWETGAALPDASNIVQLSKLFGVTTDYLLNDSYEGDQDIPAVKNIQAAANNRIKRTVALCASVCGAFGNLVIYILSRIIEVLVPHRTYINGEWTTEFGSRFVGRSYIYFIRQYDLELLAILFWGLCLGGLIYIIISSDKFKNAAARYREKARQEKRKKHSGNSEK